MGLVYHLGSNLTKFVGANFFRLQIHGRENMIEEGPALLAMNHQSYLDPPLAGICRREIHYLARKSLFAFRSSDRSSAGSMSSGRSRRRGYERVENGHPDESRGGCTIVFPEGTRTRDGSSNLRGPAGLVIAKTLAPVVPMRIFGAYEAFPRGTKWPRK